MLRKRNLARLRKDDLYKLSEISELLNVPRITLSRYVKYGLLPYTIPNDRKSKYYRLDHVKLCLKWIKELKTKFIPTKHMKPYLKKKPRFLKMWI